MNDERNGFGGQLPKESKLWEALNSKTEETTQHQDMPPESDDEGSSISDNDSDSLSTAAKIMEIVSKRKSDRAKFSKKSKNSEKRFSRRNGVIYVSDDFWAEYREYAYNAHIYVASTTTEKSIIGSTAFTNADENSTNRTSTPPKGTSISSQGKSPTGALPPRLAIVNELLLEDLSETCIKSNQHINHDQTAPYRSLIPWEGSFRKRHQSLEAEFADISHTNPTHPAVLRDSEFLPTTLAYAVTPRQDKTQAIDEIDNSRILLDGYRALIYLLDSELNQLVVSYRSINLGTVDKLPFSHLWYLFNPGQEIIVKHPRPQVYRVLQVTGGRQSLVSRKKAKGTTLESISDLVIDCFFLDYDGEHFGPMACTVGIKPYDDVRRITDLSAYPLDYDNTEYDDKPLRTYLADRGKKFAGFTKLSHQKYKGFTVRELGHFDTVDEIDSDVIIDFDLAYRLNTFLKPVFGDGVIATPTREDEEETNSPGLYYDDDELVRSKWAKWLQSTDLLQHRTPETLLSDHYILLPNRVYAYVLLSRRWCPLNIDNIKPVSKVFPGENAPTFYTENL
ncbi:hypothetical protein NUW58_g1451 [Xylaria curta]|uniref:Uncharacterized protein n=1 Tax=Xylaria curta TaxID=42375 RepID=A0ACC1PLS0_9PEZI|nr:hypothetical protein NUW58_g1451 [Xylaria curta]